MAAPPTKNPPLPVDIRPDWNTVTRVAQSACATNQGLAVITMRVFVRGTEIIWFGSPIIEERLGPRSAAEVELSPEKIQEMAAFFLDEQQEGFYVSRQTLAQMAGQRKRETSFRPE